MTEKSERETALESSVKELGIWLGKLSHNGQFNPEVAAVLEKARIALRMK